MEQPAARGSIPGGSGKLLSGKRVPFGIWFNESKWAVKEEAQQGPRSYLLTHSREDAYAMAAAFFAFSTVQIVTFTGRNLLREYEVDFFDFLNGLVMK